MSKRKTKSPDRWDVDWTIDGETIPAQFTVLGIDPGTRFLGWGVTHNVLEGHSYQTTVVDYGTIRGHGTGSPLVCGIVDEIMDIRARHAVDLCVIEDYLPYKGNKVNGAFAVPALIGVIKYVWYVTTQHEACMVPAATWKSAICRDAAANKDDIRTAMRSYLSPGLVDSIEQEYAAAKRRGSQDTIDALAVTLYGSSAIANRLLLSFARL